MTDDERAALESEQSDLTRKLAVRKRTAGYTANCEAIKARLAEIEQELAPVE